MTLAGVSLLLFMRAIERGKFYFAVFVGRYPTQVVVDGAPCFKGKLFRLGESTGNHPVVNIDGWDGEVKTAWLWLHD